MSEESLSSSSISESESVVTSNHSESDEDEIIIDIGPKESVAPQETPIKQKEVKTVFTKMSENMYKQMVQTSSGNGRLQTSYDFFMNDYHLSRMMEREDKDVNRNKAENFKKRQLEYKDTIEMKKQELVRKRIMDARDTDEDNILHRNAKATRSPTQMYNDHIQYMMKAKQKTTNKVLATRTQTFSYIPTITEASRKMNKSRGMDNSGGVYSRLYTEGDAAKLGKSFEVLEFFCPNHATNPQKKEEMKRKASESASRLFGDSKRREEVIRSNSKVKPEIKKFTNDKTKSILFDFLAETFQFHVSEERQLNKDELVTLLFNLELSDKNQESKVTKAILDKNTTISSTKVLEKLILMLGLRIEENEKNIKIYKSYFRTLKRYAITFQTEYNENGINDKQFVNLKKSFSNVYNNYVLSKKKPLTQSQYSFKPSIPKSKSVHF